MLIGREPLDLQCALIDSAQCFLWRRDGDWFGGVVAGRPAWLRQTGDGIEAEYDGDPAALRRYLDLDRDYGAIAAEFGHIPTARRAMALYPGLRVLNQPAWEALIEFILSANNNVKRIRGLCAALCERYGEALDTPRGTLHAFPTPEALAGADVEALRAMKLGYRAPYVVGAARRVAEGFPLDTLRDLPWEEAHARMVSLPGVGDKVADCALLFGCGQTSAFPVDVWVARLLESWFDCAGMSRPAMARYARERLGEHAGIMQQFLFHAARTGDMEL